MLAVSNTSPISNLASIGRLQLLQSQFATVWIPDAVFQELTAHPDPVARDSIQHAIREQWIQIGTPQNSGLLQVLLSQLHQGEAEAIALASDINADLVLIDEQEGRQLATKAGFAVTGVLGILLFAKRNGEITKIKPEIDLLRSRANFFVARSLEMQILAAAGEAEE
jgi:uncharacterized protein